MKSVLKFLSNEKSNKTKLEFSSAGERFVRRKLSMIHAHKASLAGQTDISALLCAFAASSPDNIVHFDSDSQEIIIDSGASATFSHCLQDFISFRPLSSSVSGLGTLKIKGIGTVKYNILTDAGKVEELIVKNAYYVPELQTRLLSPQQVVRQSKRQCACSIGAHAFTLRWNGNSKTVLYDKRSNLPILRTAAGMETIKSYAAALSSTDPIKCFKAKREIPVFPLQPEMEEEGSDNEYVPIDNDTSLAGSEIKPKQKTIKIKCSHKSCKDCSQLHTQNDAPIDITQITNLTDDQIELLHWHERFDHMNFHRLQALARHEIIPKRLKNTPHPVCLACQLGKGHKVSRNTNNKIVSEHVTKPGDLVHTDQAQSSQPGRPMTVSGRNNKEKINVFTLFVDSVSKKMFVNFQSSTDAAQTIEGKKRFERHAQSFNIKVKSYRADNGVFRSKDFKTEIERNDQRISYCGVGAHWQNGVAERNIRTVVERARTVLLHASSKWPDMIDTELWKYAVNHVVNQWNQTPRPDLQYLSPDEIFSGVTTRDKTTDIASNFHPFGCPVYVLEAPLQDNKSHPKWNPRMRTGIFVGHSSDHARNVALVLNPDTDIISNQYHVLFDDHFTTIDPKLQDSSKIALWEDISKRAIKNATSATDDAISFDASTYSQPRSHSDSSHFVQTINPQMSTNPGLNPPAQHTKTAVPNPLEAAASPSPKEDQRSPQREVRDRQQDSSHAFAHPKALSRDSNEHGPRPNCGRLDEDHSNSDIESVMPTARRACEVTSSGPPRRRRTPYVLHPGKSDHPTTGRRTSSRKRKPSSKVRDALETMQAYAAELAIENKHKSMTFSDQIEQMLDLSITPEGEINDLNPHAFAASLNPNILNHRDAMRAPDKADFEEAMEDEIKRMIKEEIFEEVPISAVPHTHSILGAVWSHWRKTTPDGKVYRHRSRLCVNGSQQKEGIDYTETYSPVISWTAVRIMLVLSSILGLKSKQVDYVQALPQAKLSEGEEVFMKIPQGYRTANKNTVLKIKKNCYGLKQAAYNWNNHLHAGLVQLGFKQSNTEPCLYMKEDIICLVYVDDTLFFAKDDAIIDDHISRLQKLKFALTVEGDVHVESFLGVKLEKLSDGSIKMSQTGLTETIIKALGLDNKSKTHDSPAVSPPLHKHENSKPRNEKWSYRSLIGMLTYLARNTRPDIEYAVHQCARFQIDPKLPHENAIKRIGRYLLGTIDKGLIFKPDPNQLGTIQCYVDADFAGNYSKETAHDPNSVKSRTGCVIKYGGCPITWFSRMQSEIALSTTEAEYIALSTATRELLPMRELMIEIATQLKLEIAQPTLKCTLFEDNIGAETLAKAPKMNPRTKHIAQKYHFFKQYVANGTLSILRVDTEKQLADVFTKPVPKPVLQRLRREIMGWNAMFKRPKTDKEKEKARMSKLCNLARIR